MFTSFEKEPLSIVDPVAASPHPLAGIELDVTQTQMLLSIMRRHCKLGVEHGRADTKPERRRQILEEIQSLRSTRDDLIAEWRKDVKNGYRLASLSR
ncbi:hypothetical protein [Paenibacillus tyrfis]|uniref:hypothetical protein n=1 Tax=Paenibacillus tyrfis TaxID=1501230 RepID=UPI002164F092|nr:hypothetical protein [Paenibacillus tyrfis]